MGRIPARLEGDCRLRKSKAANLARKTMTKASSRGQGLVEFAIVLPVFLLILGGVIQAGFLLWGSNTLNQVVRDTGRFAATLDCSTSAENSAEAQFATLLAGTGGPWSSPTVSVTYTDACPTDNTEVVWVDVTATVDAPVFFVWVPGDGQLTSSTRFRVEPQP